ncbi:probable E3 ubiquitin-protein ligase LubX at C-terminar half [Coccomyxa sp. Obi]|nr:probable E3 ubiquitin-protein ligase LubX at C-terminar half [Coccomyxa sp. Obi]
MRLWHGNNCCSFRALGLLALSLLCVATWVDPQFILLARFTRRLFHQANTEGVGLSKPSTPVQVQRPLDVKDWSCDDVAAWMSSQGWVWRELDQYKARACDIGVTGRTLYDLEEDVLEHDFRMQYRLHRKVFLDAISKLQSAQPKGIHFPRNLWEYRKEHPIRASVYYSGLLSAPRMTMLWLAIFEPSTLHRVHEAAVGRMRWHVDMLFPSRTQKQAQGDGMLEATNGSEMQYDDYQDQKMPDESRRGLQETARSSLIVSAFNSSVVFWLQAIFAPGLQVAFYMSLFYKRHPMALVYVGLVGLFRTAAEGHALLMLFTHPDMTAGEAFSSFICSHLMTPAMNAALAILQVALAPILPGRLAWLLFWIRCVPLPLLTLWADFAAWVPSSVDEGAEPLNGESRTRRHLNRNIVRVRRDAAASVHWPPPVLIPEELEDSEGVPDVFKCPITLGIMREPAQTPQGMTYERASIMKWVDSQKHDPCTKAPLRKRHLSPNLALRGVIENWVASQCSVRGLPMPNGALSALPKPLLSAEDITRTGGGSSSAAGSPGGAERVLGEPRQEQLHPSAATSEAAAGAASGARPRAGWLLRQRQSPSAIQLQTSEIVLPDALPSQALHSGLQERADMDVERHVALALQQLGAQSSEQQEPRQRRSGSQHELRQRHLPQTRNTAANLELQSSEILAAEAARLDEAQAPQRAQDEVIIAARARRVPQSDSPSGSASSTRNALERSVHRAVHSAPPAASRASVSGNGCGVGDLHGADISMQTAASQPTAGVARAEDSDSDNGSDRAQRRRLDHEQNLATSPQSAIVEELAVERREKTHQLSPSAAKCNVKCYYYYYYTFSSPYGLGTSSSTFMAALHSSRFLHFLRQLYGNPMASKSSLT